MTTHPPLPPAAEIVTSMERAAAGEQHVAPDHAPTGRTEWVSLLVALVESNLRQWNLEDTTRRPGASDAEIATAKRQIDRLNLGRHRLVQEIDAAIDSGLDQSATAPLATESPGMVLDRLSVLVIRRARTVAAAWRDPIMAERVVALDAQVGALSMAWDSFMDELGAGRRRFLRYESFKLYGSSRSAADSRKQ